MHLSETGGTVYLYRNDTLICQLDFGDNPVSYEPNGPCTWPSPGFANTREGHLAYLAQTQLPELVISEVLAANTAYPTDGMFWDYVEVENRSSNPIDLSDYYLTDSWENTERYLFPAVILQPGEFYTVYCSGDAATDHAPFKLSPGKTLYLAYRGIYSDVLAIPEDLHTNETYGRDGQLPVYLQYMTPGEPNSTGWCDGVSAPQPSVAPGLYDQTQQVTLTAEGTIYYTLDGAVPTTSSQVYTGPLTVSGVTTIRTFCVQDGRKSAIMNYPYAIGVDHDLPILSIAIPLYSRSQLLSNIKSSTEHPSVMSLIEDGEVKFSIPFGIRLHGNDSRHGRKKNFQLRFRGEYGAGKLEYRLFDDRDIDEFDSLLLKGGSEDAINAVVRDELATDIANGTSALYTQAMKPVVLYLGGEYWGIHYLRERYSAAYVASHLDVSEESVDLLFSTDGYVQEGSNADLNALKRYVKTHDMSTTENYYYLAERIDVTSLIDWYAFRTYLDDRDFANIRRFRSLEADGKWHWCFFDMDWGFYNQGRDPVSNLITDFNGEPTLMRALLASREGRDAFLTRYAYLMRTVLNETYINQRLDALLAQIGSEMPRDRARWGYEYSAWENHIGYIREFSRDANRVPLILADIQNYFGLTNSEMDHYFGDLT